MVNYCKYPSPFGELLITEENGQLTSLLFSEPMHLRAELHNTPVLQQAAAQLEEYFAGRRYQFELPYLTVGSFFDQAVRKAMLSIPYGETRSYKQVAELCGNANAARAVGQACNRNPLPIFIPCHRVIGADHRLVGFSSGVEIKRALLDFERANKPQ